MLPLADCRFSDLERILCYTVCSPSLVELIFSGFIPEEEWRLYRDALRWSFFPNLEFRVRLEKNYELSSNFFSLKIKIFSKVCINIINNMY